MRGCRTLLAVAWLSAWGVAPAMAESFIVPFVGTTFKGQTTLPLFGVSTLAPTELARRLDIGVAGVWLSPGVLGAELEFAHSPRFFERAGGNALFSSSATTVIGSVVVAAPLSVTRESLRPYLVGGLGWLHAGRSDLVNLAPVDRDLLAMNLGGGAIGMLGKRAGLRFDVRQTRSVRDDRAPQSVFLTTITQGGRLRLSYWRATVGVTIKY